ncbi:ABC-three component system middle component 6 [Brevundimonas diminuta]|uniref:ABC-three component system middle component 6 n=1 Tax=Brevundimonas diminuta TaxID=293 RepID=UPI0030FC7E4F
MILPTKHIRPDRALLAVGADVLGCLREPMTVSRLWDEIRSARADRTVSAPINYDWFILALDLLFMVHAVQFNRGLLQKSAA